MSIPGNGSGQTPPNSMPQNPIAQFSSYLALQRFLEGLKAKLLNKQNYKSEQEYQADLQNFNRFQQMIPQTPPPIQQQPQIPQPVQPPKQTKRHKAEVSVVPLERSVFIQNHDEISYEILRHFMNYLMSNPQYRMRVSDGASMAVYQALYLYVRKMAQRVVKAARRRRNDCIYKERHYPPNAIPLYRFSLLAAEKRALESNMIIRDTHEQMPLEVIAGIAARKVGTDREELLPLVEKEENDLVLPSTTQLEQLPETAHAKEITIHDFLFVCENDPTFDQTRIIMHRHYRDLKQRMKKNSQKEEQRQQQAQSQPPPN